MDRFSKLLPDSIKQKIYEFDNTYKDAYDLCLGEMICNELNYVLIKRQKRIIYTYDENDENTPLSNGYISPTNIVRQSQEEFGDDDALNRLVEFKKILERTCSINYTAVLNLLDEFKIKSNVMKPETLIKECEKQIKIKNMKTMILHRAVFQRLIVHFRWPDILRNRGRLMRMAYRDLRKRYDNHRLQWLYDETCVEFPELSLYYEICKLLAILNHDIDLFNFEESQPDVDWMMCHGSDDEDWEEEYIPVEIYIGAMDDR